MKVLFLNSTDIAGGAARASYRLYKGLQSKNVDVNMLVQTKQSDDVSIIVPRTRLSRGAALLRPFLDSLPLFLYSAPNKFNFSPAVVPDSLARIATSVAPDIVHLHWVCEGFIRLESIKRLSRPILWTLHDSWAFTGGCHTPFDCLRYQDSCGTCPALGSLRGNDFSRRVWQRKKNAWKGVNLTVVAPSHWLASCVMSSSLFREVRVEVIPNGLDMQCYRPIDKHFARDLLSLPQNKKLILYNGIGSIVDPNKGRHQLIKAMRELSANGWEEKAEVVVFGISKPIETIDYGINVRYLGKLHDDISIAMLYSSVDTLVVPSIQENLPNTIMEAMACGIPCVAFKTGGIPDMIRHKQNGYLAKPYDTSDLAEGIDWVLQDNDRQKSLSEHARKKIEKDCSLDYVVRKYLDLYKDILN